MNNLTLVIPAKFEATTLPVVLKEIKELNLNCKKIVVVPKYDEETLKVLENTDCEILIQKGEGFGNALIEGLNHSKTEFSCIFNADGSFDPKYLDNMLSLCEEGNEFIFCSRYLKKGGSEDDTIITLFGNYIFSKLGRIFFSLKISDILYTYIIGDTKFTKSLNLKSEDFRICVELPIKVHRKGYNYTDYGCYELKRIGGKKKVNAFKDGFLILSKMISMFFSNNFKD